MVQYLPPDNLYGTAQDAMSYLVQDHRLSSAVSVVTFDILPINDVVTIIWPSAADATEDSTKRLFQDSDWSFFDFDDEGNDLEATVTIPSNVGTLQAPVSSCAVTAITNGMTVNCPTPDLGTFFDQMILVPVPDYYGAAVLNTSVVDSHTGPPVHTVNGTVLFIVEAVNDAPDLTNVAAGHSGLNGVEDTILSVTAPFVVFDRDAEGQNMLVTVECGDCKLALSGSPVGVTMLTGTNTKTLSFQASPADATTVLASNIQATPDHQFNGNTTLTITVNDQANTGTVAQESVMSTLLFFDAVADVPILSVQDATGNEDTDITALSTASTALGASSESLVKQVVTLGQTGSIVVGGTVVGPLQFSVGPMEDIVVRGPLHWAGDIAISVELFTSEPRNGDEASVVDNCTVTILPVATTPTINLIPTTVNVNEDQGKTFAIDAVLEDVDGSEILYAILSGVEGVITGATSLGGGVWRVESANFASIELIPVLDSGREFNVTVTIAAEETETNEKATVAQDISFSIFAIADPALLTTGNITIDEG